MKIVLKDPKKLLSQAAQLEEIQNPVLYRSLLITVACMVMAFVVWSAITDISEIARAPGEVVPDGYVKTVQHLEGGIVDQILVHEGDAVKKGQVLIVLNGSGIKEDLARTQSQLLALSLQEERLRAYMQNRKPDFTKFGNVPPELLTDQHMFFKNMQASQSSDQSIVAEQVKQKQMSLRSLYTELKAEKDNLEIERSLYAKREALYRRGFYSEARYLQSKQALTEAQGRVQVTASRIGETEAQISEYKSRLTGLSAQGGDRTGERLDTLIAEKKQTEETIKKLTDRVARLDIRSSTDGWVTGMKVTTIGAVVRPAEPLMEIVPQGEKMMVEVKVLPQDIARLQIGQPVNVKVSSYDFSRDGYVPGKLSYLSAATFTSPEGDKYYQGRIAVDHEYVGDSRKNVILPGMTVMAEIVTGEKTILQYLLKPVHNSLRTAFTEK